MSLSKEQAIEQLNQALQVCQQAGLQLGVSPMFGTTATHAIMLDNEFGYTGGKFYLNGHDNERTIHRDHHGNPI